MKNLSLLLLTAILFIGCQQKGQKRYTQKSPEIDTVKKLTANYNNKSYDINLYADTAKTYYNTKDNHMSPSETIAYHKQNDAVYSKRGFLEADQEYEMVVTDDGETWVNCWLDWEATLAANNQKYDMPIHLTYQFVNGKIVKEYGYWDPSALVLAFNDAEAKKVADEEESD